MAPAYSGKIRLLLVVVVSAAVYTVVVKNTQSGRKHRLDNTTEGLAAALRELKLVTSERDQLRGSMLHRRGSPPLPESATAADSAPAAESGQSSALALCRRLPRLTPTAQALWKSHLSEIFAASKHPRDPDYDYVSSSLQACR